MTEKTGQHATQLKRGLNLPLLTLYGLGVTIGAGIYVLVGATAAEAGIYAPVSFLLAAIVVAFTGLSYAEFGTRYPVSAGEAAYVRAGFNSQTLSLIVGLLVAGAGIVSSAAIAIGAAGYIGHFLPLPHLLLAALVILLLGFATSWGIVESVIAAAIFTVIEIVGLLFVIAYGIGTKPEIVGELPSLVPPLEAVAWSGVMSAGLLAFFAFAGFEDIANVAEEVKEPRRTLPVAILLTLVVSTLIYLAVVAVVVLSVPMDKLAGSKAPLALMFEGAGGHTSGAFNLIASIATVNGILVQMIMASRVLYGLSRQNSLPAALSYVHPKTRTPLVATALVTGVILVLALFFPINNLAEWTSIIVLAAFTLVNLALIALKWRGGADDGKDVFTVPMIVPVLGFLTSAGMLLSGLL